MAKVPKPNELEIAHKFPHTGWMDTPVEFKPGTWCYPGKIKNLQALDLPNPREWSPADEDWKLPSDWKQILLEGLRERLHKYRSLRIFMDICVRCGACADKSISTGSGDRRTCRCSGRSCSDRVRRNSPSRKIWQNAAPGAHHRRGEGVSSISSMHGMRRCSLFCPYGSHAEVTIVAGTVNLIGLISTGSVGPVATVSTNGNHLEIQPHAFKDMIDFFVDEIEGVNGVRVEPTFNRKGAEILFITPSGDVFADPGTYTLMGYLMLFHEIGLDYTWSTYASEGGNFGLFTSHEMMKRLNAKMYAEAKRLGVKYIIGGECGHMWRVINQYMDTMNGPADFLEVPKSPITGTVFDSAKSTKMIHIVEFTADLIRNGKLKLDPTATTTAGTYHDSCNPAARWAFS